VVLALRTVREGRGTSPVTTGCLLPSLADNGESLEAMVKMGKAEAFQFHLVPGDHFTILRRPNVRIIAEALEYHVSANGSNASQAVSPETVRYSF